MTEHVAPQMANHAKRPSRRWPMCVEKPPAITSAAEPDQVNIDDKVRLWVTHCMRAPYSPIRAIINDESDGKEEEWHQPRRRRTKITSGKLRTMDTTAIKEVLWPHKLVFSPDG